MGADEDVGAPLLSEPTGARRFFHWLKQAMCAGSARMPHQQVEAIAVPRATFYPNT